MTSEKNGGNLVTLQWINPKTNRPSLFLATKARGGNADYDDVIFSDAANKAQFSQLFRTGSTTEFALDLHGYLVVNSADFVDTSGVDPGKAALFELSTK